MSYRGMFADVTFSDGTTMLSSVVFRADESVKDVERDLRQDIQSVDHDSPIVHIKFNETFIVTDEE